MRVSIIGWYGTETLGDVAILDGILSVLKDVSENCEVLLGSLHPFFCERTLYEEKTVFAKTAPNVKIKIFDSLCLHDRKKAVGSSDLVVVGGGPLMGLEALHMIKNCFLIAQKKHIPTMILGCGVGPLHQKKYVELVDEIVQLTDYVSFRDKLSCNSAKTLFKAKKEYFNLGDPAVISIEQYKKENLGTCKKNNELTLNFRAFPKSAYGGQCFLSNKILKNYLCDFAHIYEKVNLVPMHTFSIGGDDREYLSSLVYDLDVDNIIVHHIPKNLGELYSCYMNAKACGGMRYHSVVMQTILNGNNIVFNYTDKEKGKTMGFIKEMDKNGFYENRLIQMNAENAEEELEKAIAELNKNEIFEYKYTTMKNDYVQFIKKALGLN